MKQVKKFGWLIRRELWEHKGMLLWTPLILAGFMLGVTCLILLKVLTTGDVRMIVNGQHIHMHASAMAGNMLLDNPQVIDAAATNYVAASMPLFLVLTVVMFFYCLSALYDERRDRSLLFWKSLPVSDAQTVWSKALLALVLAPLFIVVLGSLLSGLQLLLFCAVMAGKGVNVFGPVLGNPAFYLGPLRLLGVLPVYVLWALPTVGWLLLVSAWARSKVFLWAVGLPLLAGVLAVWANRLLGLDVPGGWFFEHVVARGLLGTAPGSWLLFDRASLPLDIADGTRHFDMADLFQYSWGSLAGVKAWLGGVVGVAMIYGAIRLRGSRDET
jgi:ABC-2 type transport system permease protein